MYIYYVCNIYIYVYYIYIYYIYIYIYITDDHWTQETQEEYYDYFEN